jgi:hypothetical protein
VDGRGTSLVGFKDLKDVWNGVRPSEMSISIIAHKVHQLCCPKKAEKQQLRSAILF